MCTPSRRLLSSTFKLASSAGAIAAVLALAGTAWSGEHPKPGPDEVFTLNTVIQVPGSSAANPFFSFDISWFDPVRNKYFLADRNNKAIDVIKPANNSIEQFVNPGFAGVLPSPAAPNNDISGPDGVLTVDHKELWIGDSPGKVWVLNAKNGDNLLGAGKFISVGGTTRADELCFDPNNHVIMIASPAEESPPGTPAPFVTFISTTTRKVLSRLIFNGSIGPQGSAPGWPVNGAGINAIGGLEQCGWSPLTGKFYQNVPVKDPGPGGTIAVINPKTMLVETDLPVPNADCNLPQGMAIGPNHQIMEGCAGPSPATGSPPTVHRNTVLMSDTGDVLATYPDLGGADEVWFNEGDGHYFVPNCNQACRVGTGPELLGVIDSSNLMMDQTVVIGGPIPAGTARRIHSVAADSHTNKVYLPIPANTGTDATHPGVKVCDDTTVIRIGDPSSSIGCIAVYTTKHDDHKTTTARERGDDDRQE